MREFFALLLAVFAFMIPGLAIFKFIPNAMNLAIWEWLMVSAIGGAIGGVLYRPRRWLKTAIAWSLIVAGGLAGSVGYLYLRTVMFPTGFLLRLEYAIGFLAGIMPGLFLNKYWFGSSAD